MLFYAVAFISLACIFYTVGVWAEKLQRRLKGWHVVVFWAGFVCDTIGTTAMSRIAGGFQYNFHGITGFLAIVLMLFHAVWATIVISRNNEKLKAKFHRLSIVIWFIWLIPMLSGMIMGVGR